MSRTPITLLIIALLFNPSGLFAQQIAITTETARIGGTELRVRSMPDDTEVTINNRYVGRTPLTVTDLAPGTHRVSLSRSGYRTVERWVRLRDNAIVEIDVVLEQRIGFLAATVFPATAELFIDGIRLSDPPSRLPIGEYRLTAELFGYRTESRTIKIEEHKTTQIALVLEAAEFDLSRPRTSTRILNPLNPGPSGRLTVRFTATAPGNARYSVIDAEGVIVHTGSLSDIRSAEQRFEWSGRNVDGTPVPDGEYTIRIQGANLQEAREISRQTRVRVDSTVRTAYRSLFGGTAGAVLTPDATVLPARAFQLSAGGLSQWSPTGSDLRLAAVHLGLRVGLGSGLETALTGDVVISEAVESVYLQSTASVRWAWAQATSPDNPQPIGALDTALTLATSDGGPTIPRDPTANHSGFRLSAPTGFAFRNFSLIAAPGLMISDSHPVESDQKVSGRFPLFWAYVRSALIYDSGETVAAISTAIRSASFDRGFRFVGPLSAAVEFHQLVPNTPLFVSAIVSAELQTDALIRAGVGLGLIR